MSSYKSTVSRRVRGVHFGRRTRKKIRRQLAEVFGDKCCWCGEPMIIPKPGENVKDLKNLATIEHYFAKEMGDPNNIMFLRLAHERCNK